MPHLSVRWIITVLATTAAVGGGIAAAGTGDDGTVLEEPVTTTSTMLVTTTTLDDGGSDEVPDGEADDETEGDGTERYWGPECGDGEPTNHGQYVSSSDKDGESRREAAHSPCGKPLHTVDVTATTTAAPVPDESGNDGDESVIGPQGGSSNGNGNGHAFGNSKHKGGPKKG